MYLLRCLCVCLLTHSVILLWAEGHCGNSQLGYFMGDWTGQKFSLCHTPAHTNILTHSHKNTLTDVRPLSQRERDGHDRKIEQDDRLSHWFTAKHKFSAQINSCEFLTRKRCPACVCVCVCAGDRFIWITTTTLFLKVCLDCDRCYRSLWAQVCVGMFMTFLQYRENVIHVIFKNY